MSAPRGKHEIKTRPRCGRPFECRSHRPVHCDCARITLDEGTLGAIEGHYRDCLCLACLTALAAGADLALADTADLDPSPVGQNAKRFRQAGNQDRQNGSED